MEFTFPHSKWLHDTEKALLLSYQEKYHTQIFSEKSQNRTLGIIQQIQMMIMCTDRQIKVKINFSLCLKSQHHTLKIYWKMQLYTFLTLPLDGDERSPS
jgi:hypothetical protein